MEHRKNKIRRIPELLAPAGNFEKLVTAIHYGLTQFISAAKISVCAPMPPTFPKTN